ncbi:MAG TPA: hypothetical protein VNU70_00940 [Puia sp.]|jgi:hypothetical protein|nr:hypothetical protein [Puia sp.]
MQKFLLIAVLFLPVRFVRGQSLSLDIHSNKLADYIGLEKRMDSKKVENKSNYILERGVAQPIIYQRKQEDVPDLLCYYFYYEKDSAIQYILYEWDETNFRGYQENARKTFSEITGFIDKYNALYAQIAERYGKSAKQGDLSDTSRVEEGMERTDQWKPDDSTAIKLETVLSNKYRKNGLITINPTFRIRLYVRNTGRSQPAHTQELSEERAHTLDTISRGFFLAMKSKDWELARSYLSSLVSQKVTDTQLEQLSQAVRFDEKMELFFKGVQYGLDGSTFYLLQYKYSGDTNMPPKVMVKLIFDDTGKIAGVRPMKML